MDRITTTNLRGLLGRMTRTMGAPAGPVWTPREDGKGSRATVGALLLQSGSRTYGNAWTIAQIMNESGGERTVLCGSTARELWDVAQAWLDGWEPCEIAARKRLGHRAYEGKGTP